LTFRTLARLAARLLARLTVHGVDNIPLTGPVLLTMNHLGGADPVLCIGHCPRRLETLGKAEALRWPVIGLVLRAYGMIPVRRGEPDRATLARALEVLESGGALLIAPEGRESLSGALEAGKHGAAFLAQHAAAPIVPVGITGTAWRAVLPSWRRLRRPCVTLTFGPPYTLPAGLDRREATEEIMRRIAALLPPEYRGVYAPG
jgi:1-acyl-sn-glycerol-3-phosphate acyltransferase